MTTNVVGRAEYKLAGALKAFKINLREKTVLDIGSSTGGFTEAVLRAGARRVIAIEKGTKQMRRHCVLIRELTYVRKLIFLMSLWMIRRSRM